MFYINSKKIIKPITFTKFKNHIDNVKETIAATDINKIQVSANTSEDNIAELRQKQFETKVLFEFEHNTHTNALYIDDFSSLVNINASESSNFKYDEKEQSLTCLEKTIPSEIYTKSITSTTGNDSSLNNFYLSADMYIPTGASIDFFVIIEDRRVFPIKANTTKTPLIIKAKTSSVKIRIVLTANKSGIIPKIYSIALSFVDLSVKEQYDNLKNLIFNFEGSEILDISDYYTKLECDDIFANKNMLNQIMGNFLNYYTKSETYNKEEVFNREEVLFQITEKINELISSAPESLDTLNELATALNNDPSFATNIINLIGEKASINHVHDYNDLLNKPPSIDDFVSHVILFGRDADKPNLR